MIKSLSEATSFSRRIYADKDVITFIQGNKNPIYLRDEANP